MDSLFYSVDYNSLLSLFILMFSCPRLAGGTPLSLCPLAIFPSFFERFFAFWQNGIFPLVLCFSCSSPGISHSSKKPVFVFVFSRKFNQDLNVRHSHCYCAVPASRTERVNTCMLVYVDFYILTYFC